ncbi:DUF1254 domain-containing protein [Leifsonia sp. NPDC056665]|uniref:DUF1254 domain-containing protein n=1 Tax=Leifsonia sp. NPDC056665 TaxID=3345901 RepID=UPI0036B95055
MSVSLQDLAARAYLFGFPLVFNLDQVNRYVTTGVGKNAATPWNRFSHARSLAGPADTFVTINNDTVYSMAQIDLGVGPVRLRVPDTAGRYYVLQFVSAWTDNFAYIGHRATDTKAATYLLVPPEWDGEPCEGETVIHFPTRTASIVGRWAVAGDDDLPAVHALQDAAILTPSTDAVPEGLPEYGTTLSQALQFYDKLRVWSQAFPPASRDAKTLASFEAIGLAAVGPTPYGTDPQLDAALQAGYAKGQAMLEELVASGGGNRVVNGWNLTYHSFDYNLDYFEVGSLDDPAFKIVDPERRIVQRAGAALGGLWGNQSFEAAYIATYVDDRGDRLTGDHTYTLTLNPPPPVDAFWSLTMYDVPDYYLVANRIKRYSIGDRTPGIRYEDDGSLIITISHAEPTEGTARANWLPAPSGEFRPILRMYEPRSEILDQTYLVPAITRV